MADRASRIARSDINPPVKAPRLTLGAQRDEAELDADVRLFCERHWPRA